MLAINEEFSSCQGEGQLGGTRMYFVRTQGCDVGCYFCDTKYTWKPSDQIVDERDIVKRALESKCEWVCITGGEPLEQDLTKLVDQILETRTLFLMIETSGIVYHPILDRFHFICCSPKDLFTTRNYTLDKEFIRKAHEMKCVVTKESDIDFYLNLLKDFNGIKTFQPVDNNSDIVEKLMGRKDIMDWKIRIQQQKVMEVR